MSVVSRENSMNNSQSPTDMRMVNAKASRRSRSLSKSPVRKTSIRMPCHDSPGTSKTKEQMSRAREVSRHRTDSSQKRSKDSARDVSPVSYYPDIREFSQSPPAHCRPLHSELKKKDNRHGSDVCLLKRNVQPLPNSSEEVEYPPGREREEKGPRGNSHERHRSAKLLKRDASLVRMELNKQAVDDERRYQQGSDEYNKLHRGAVARSKKKTDKKSQLDTRDSDSEETNSYRNENMEKRRHKKKSEKRKRDYVETSESDSKSEDKKEVKRRRKDDKWLRKEERRRRREERHRRKLERRAGKIKLKSRDTVSPLSDFEMDHGDAGVSDGGSDVGKNSHLSNADETEAEQKKLEIELREKALESLRAKKAISH